MIEMSEVDEMCKCMRACSTDEEWNMAWNIAIELSENAEQTKWVMCNELIHQKLRFRKYLSKASDCSIQLDADICRAIRDKGTENLTKMYRHMWTGQGSVYVEVYF